jgi:hypothetical protein
MDPKVFIKLLGYPADAPEVRNLLTAFGATIEPKLKRGDVDVNIDITDAGMYFVFTDEAFARKRRGVAIGAGPLLLTNVSMCSDAMSGYTTYAGPLPFSLSFSDGRDAVRSKLGPPEDPDDQSTIDRWTKCGVWVFADYADDFQSTVSVGVQLPDPD